MKVMCDPKSYQKLMKFYNKIKPQIDDGTISEENKMKLIKIVQKIVPHECNKIFKKNKSRLPTIKENVLF